MSTDCRWAIRLEGVGDVSQAATQTEGTLFGWGTRPSGLASSWGWVDALAGPPRQSAVELAPFEANGLRDSTWRASVKASRQTRLLLLAPAPLPAGVLTSALDASATSVSVGVTTLAGQVIEVGYESILLGTHAGSGTYTGCVRGVFGTTARAHAAGLYVTTRPAWWLSRRMEVYWVEGGASAPTKVGHTLLDAEPETNDVSTRIELTGRGVTGQLDALESNRNATRWLARHTYGERKPAYWYEATDGTREPELYGNLPGFELGPATRKITEWGADGLYSPIMVGSTLTWTRGGILNGARPLAGSPRPEVAPDAGDANIFGYIRAVDTPVYEVLAVGEVLDAEIRQRTGNSSAALSPTVDCASPYHLLTLWAALLFSLPETTSQDEDNFDVLGPGWALGQAHLRSGAIGTIEDLTVDAPEARIELMVLGADGGPVAALARVTRELASYGIHIAPDRAGLPRAVHIRPAVVDEANAAPTVQGLGSLIGWRQAAGSPVDTLSARLGDLPWDEGVGAAVTLLGPGTGPGSRAEAFGRERRGELYFGARSVSSRDAVALGELYDAVSWRHLPMPTIRALAGRPEVTGADCLVGDYVRVLPPAGLETAVYPTPDGADVVATLSGDEWIGQIVSRRMTVSGALELRVLLVNYAYGQAVRWRAPSLRITGTANSGTRLTCSSTSIFGASGSDSTQFTVGDEVVMCGPDLAPRSSEVRTVTARTNDYIDINVAFTTAPSSGEYLELADSDDYSNTGAVGSDYARPWAYMSDGGELLASEEGDRYG